MKNKAFLLLSVAFFILHCSFLFAQATLTVVYPAEDAKLPVLSQSFVFGAATPGSTLVINGATVPVHMSGGFLAMVPVTPGPNRLHFAVISSSGEIVQLDRTFTVAESYKPLPEKPVTLQTETLDPDSDLILAPGDTLRVSFQGSSKAHAEFVIPGIHKHVPMVESGADYQHLPTSTPLPRGFYEGTYVIQPGDKIHQLLIDVVLRHRDKVVRAKTRGHLTVDNGALPRIGVVTEDTVAVRTAPEGGYDVFLFKGMRVQLTGKINTLWRVRLSSTQSGWIKENAIRELPPGTPKAHSVLGNIVITHQDDSTLLRIPLDDLLPYRMEQTLNPPQLTLTLYGAVDRTDLIRYDAEDHLIQQVRWRQLNPDTCQLVITPRFKKWWGYDVRYEGTSLVVEIRKPWVSPDVKGMVIAVDAGHGGSEMGATSPRGLKEKEVNLQIAREVAATLEKAGAVAVLTRDRDMDVPLPERPRLAWGHRAQLFVSIHCNASGAGENPLVTNGHSTYWYQPQSQALAEVLHAQYRKETGLPDRGLFYADFAVCRMTQMPSVLIEQAYIIVPEQEALLFDPAFQKKLAGAVLNGIRDYLHEK